MSLLTPLRRCPSCSGPFSLAPPRPASTDLPKLRPPLFTLLSMAQHQNDADLFDEVITNPASFREDGLLELRRRVDPNGPQHGCKVGCSPNMCKGARARPLAFQQN